MSAGEGPAETQDSARSTWSGRMTVAITNAYVQKELSRVTQKLYRHSSYEYKEKTQQVKGDEMRTHDGKC